MATPIAAQDLTWLLMDRPNNLMQVNGLMFFDRLPSLPVVSRLFMERAVEKFRVLSQVPVERDGEWFWVDDNAFDIGRHVRRVHLDDDDPETLRAHVGAQFSLSFSREHPLWEVQVISGPGHSGPGAVMTRFHHGLADGIRLVQLALSVCDRAEGSTPRTVGRYTDGEHHHPLDRVLQVASHTVRDGLDFAKHATAALARAGTSIATTNPLELPSLLGEAVDLVRHPVRLVDAVTDLGSLDNEMTNSVRELSRMVMADESQTGAWSGHPGVEKSIAWIDAYPLRGLRHAARDLGCTLNDLLLAAVSLGLTDYLAERGVGAEVEDLSWLMPISLQPVDGSLPPTLGNHFCVVQMSMPLGIADHRALVREIHERSTRLKNSAEPIAAFGMQKLIAKAPSALAREVTNYFSGKTIGQLSNVPGPRVQLTLGGAPVRSMLGWVPTSGDQPLGICIFTYNDLLNIGIASDARMLPDPEQIATRIRHHLDALVGAGAES